MGERGVKTATANRLRGEIKDLLKEASSLSQPSTFAQAAKLRRMAAVKEKELANCTRKVLSWRAGGILNENVMVGIIPWLILSTRPHNMETDR
ncbi:hypothetical protein Prudu_020204 [Prunus dulcis]|uniref:Uncharacterized protein n=1 Tax=Prunus dulcis TaxID=3755 RepID=A0A4Y1RVX2_PRUDU|nr:hypothetical protein Prudu_020204 [Prunus dulcis]